MDDLSKYVLEKLDKMDDKLDSIRDQAIETKTKLSDHDMQDTGRMERINSSLGEMNQKLGEYNEQLKIHIKGVQTLKEMHGELREEVEPVVKDYEIRKGVNTYGSEKWALRIKRATYVSIVAGIIVSLLKAYKMI